MENKTILTRGRAIRAKCMDCMAGQQKEVKICDIIDCSLWPYRMGRKASEADKTTLSDKNEGILGYNK